MKTKTQKRIEELEKGCRNEMTYIACGGSLMSCFCGDIKNGIKHLCKECKKRRDNE